MKYNKQKRKQRKSKKYTDIFNSVALSCRKTKKDDIS